MFAFFQFTGSVEPSIESVEFCSNHENCETTHAHIKMTKGFVSKEPVKGRMVSPQSQLFCMFSVKDGSKSYVDPCCEGLKLP